ncbi:MAG TPA: DUF998 domain-containing protein [Dermatophilaceae bacterium]|nr:DUF998 domain-containing protein [Dermatophilaceae bacterium]
MTNALLIIGVATTLVFLVVVIVEGTLRPNYNPSYHMVSALSSGGRGWVQVSNFLQMGIGMLAFSVAINQTLDTVVGSALVAVFGAGAIASGLFSMDPSFGYPPGSPPGMPSRPTWQHQIHGAAGAIMFLAIFGACLAIAGRLDGGWRIYTLATAGLGIALTVSTMVASLRDASKTGLIQRALIFVYWTWIALLGIHLL